MSLPSTSPHLTASLGGAPLTPEWVTMLEIQAKAEALKEAAIAKAKHEVEVLTRTYVQSPKRNASKDYDDRLHERMNCGKTKAYELLKMFERHEEGGLAHARIGKKYIVTEEAVQEWFRSFGMQVSNRKAA